MGSRDPEIGNTSGMNQSSNDTDSKLELQRRVEAKREEIAHTVDEIRTTLSEEVRERKEAMREAMDWKYYVRKNPVACVGGAAAIGFFIGKALANKAAEKYYHEEPDWRDRAANYMHSAERKLDEWRGRSQGESKWKARTRSAFSSTSDLIFRELMKTAQHMIIPTVVAAVTGKMASDNKTTVVEKNVVKTPHGQPDREFTTGVAEFDKDGDVKKEWGNPSADSPSV